MSDPLHELEQRLLNDPTARAKFLADTFELLGKNGVDLSSPEFQRQIQSSLDLTQGSRFMGGLAASSVVIVAASAGQRGAGVDSGITTAALPIAVAVPTGSQVGSGIGRAASSVVIVAASAGQRGAGVGSGIGQAASSVVIVAASAGQRGAGLGSGIGQAASSVVIVAASAGQRGAGVGSNIGQAASTVVLVAASAGQRGQLGGIMAGGQEALQQPVTITIPAAATIAEIALGLRAIADLLSQESVALDEQVKALAPGPQGTPPEG